MSQRNVEEERLQRLVAMGEMAAQIAHEIRNPLGSMELFCSLLKKDLKNQPEPFQLAEQIHKSIRALDRIITSCLQFTKDIQPQFENIASVVDFCREGVIPLQLRAQEEGAEILVNGSDQIEGRFDSHLIQQVLTNLILNALDAVKERKHKDATAPKGTVTVSVERGDAGIVIEVSDNGVGMNEEVLNRLFDPFYTTKERGTGLGLAISFSIVKAHGGTLSAASTHGAGATFSLWLPIHKE